MGNDAANASTRVGTSPPRAAAGTSGGTSTLNGDATVRKVFRSPAKAPSSSPGKVSGTTGVRGPRGETRLLKKKMRPCAARYLPPGVKKRHEEQERWELEKAERRRRLAEEDAALAAGAKKTSTTTSGPNIRTLARKWQPQLEQHGTCCFNPLQKDEGVKVDMDGVCAECSEVKQSCAGPGVKGLPMVAGGRYHYEVELLRESAVIVGWSVATSLPSAYDAHAFGYGPWGRLVGYGYGSFQDEDAPAYGPPFGQEGDVIGAFVEWPFRNGGPRISFALNGVDLGVAFDLSEPGRELAGFPPLQLHLCQAPGPEFKVLLRGASPSVPLHFPSPDYVPLGDSDEAHFCPFSSAVAQAGDVRVAASLDAEDLEAFHLPDSHIVELVCDQLADYSSRLEELACEVARLLGLWSSSTGSVAPDAFGVCRTGPRTALAAFRLRAHADRCMKALGPCAFDKASIMLAARRGCVAMPLHESSLPSRRELAERRGTDFRAPGLPPTVARRLIHGSLGLQLPLSHLAQEQQVEGRQRSNSDDSRDSLGSSD